MSLINRVVYLEQRLLERRCGGQITLTHRYDRAKHADYESFLDRCDEYVKKGYAIISIVIGDAPRRPGAIVIQRSYGMGRKVGLDGF